MRKGVADIWWVIIGAAIALVAMIVLIVIFTGQSTGVQQGLLDCGSKGGQCVTASECVDPGRVVSTFECQQEEQVCCFGLQ